MDNIFYVDKKWLEKRELILKRDNYTCQNCQTFNPSIGCVILNNPVDGSLEIHSYASNPGSSVYTISSAKYDLNVEIDFDQNWLVLPILQVHHKRYIQNKREWEYNDSDLITLCKKCHTYLHNNHEIPVYDSREITKQNKKFTPKDEGSGRIHNHKPWTFIYLNKEKEYALKCIIQPYLRILVPENDNNRIEEIREIAKTMYIDFFKRYLPQYYSL